MDTSREHLLRFLDGALPDAEAQELLMRLASDAGLRGELDRVRAMRDALRGRRADSFALGFPERVMRRIADPENADDALYGALGWLFKRAAIAGLVAATIFGALNISEYRDQEISTSVIESIFGLPSVSLGDAMLVEPV
jgi:anti-sigma factor RsiW